MRTVLLALATAACIAIASALQHHAASDENPAVSGGRLMLRLVRKPRWTAGLLFSGASFALHGAALDRGRLGVVQPLLVTSLIFALPIRTALDRLRVSAAEVAAAVVLALALTGFLVAAHPTPGTVAPDDTAAGVVLAAGAALAMLASGAARLTRSPTVAGVVLGAATGVLYGLVGGALKATVHQIRVDSFAVGTTWPLWALLAAGGWALVTNQQAYAHAPLRTSLPVLMVLNPVSGVVFGAYVFAEKPADTPSAVVAQVLCLTVMAASVAVLAARADPATRRIPS